MSFQDDEVEKHSIDTIDDAITPLNDSNGVFCDVDDGHDNIDLRDAVEPDLWAIVMEDNEDENMSIDIE